MKKRSEYFTKAEVIEAFRLAIGSGKVPGAVFFKARGAKESEPSQIVLDFLKVEPVVEQLYRRRAR